MKPARPGSIRSFPAWVIPLGITAFLPLSGCLGGTSSEGGNPEIVLLFREGGKPAATVGALQFIVSGSNPEFVANEQEGGVNAARLEIQSGPAPTPFLTGQSSYTFERDSFVGIVSERPYLGLAKSSAAHARSWDTLEIPGFNAILSASGDKVAYLADVHLDPAVLHGVPYSRDTLVLEIAPGKEYTGMVDNSTPAGKALALFVPGTIFYAQVKEDDSFVFTGVPEGKLPLRWVTTGGIVHDMTDSLGEVWTHPLRPGPRQDSIYVPPVLAAPVATPPGKFSFSDSVAVTLAAAPGATVRYTLDGNAPDASSPAYKSPIVLRANRTLKAAAFRKGWIGSPVSVDNYELVPYTPVASPAGKSFQDSQVVTLSVKSRNATIRYTLDGSPPGGDSSLLYSSPIVLKGSATLKAVALVPGLDASRVLKEEYTLVPDSLVPPP